MNISQIKIKLQQTKKHKTEITDKREQKKNQGIKIRNFKTKNTKNKKRKI